MARSDLGLPFASRAASSLRSCLPLLAGLGLGGCSEGVFNPQGPIGSANREILFDSLGIMLAIVLPTILGLLGVAWWYRASNHRARYLPNWEYSGRIEMVVWSIPAMTVFLLGGICWVGSHDLDPARPLAGNAKPVTVQVVSLDWKWLFIYPDQGIASVNRLVVPAGTPISFQLTSSGVMNSFFVPQLGSQIYTMAGMVSRLNLQADKPGTYPGISAQFSGQGFPDMDFTVQAVPPEQFAQWAAATRGKGPKLDARSYAQLALPSQHVQPTTFGDLDSGLFRSILHPELPSITAKQASGTASAKED